jgi:alpha-1,2-glucosyltransferase
MFNLTRKLKLNFKMAEKTENSLLYSFILISSILYSIYNEFEDIPIYMDEKFHLNQTISYYNNNYYSWDNKLTTFPGTFFIGSLFFKIFHFLHIPITEKNSIKIARLLIVIISILSFIILSLFKKKNSIEPDLKYKFQLIISLFPINFFFNFLYYTDALSIFSLILFFYLNLYFQKNYFLRFLSGILCILIRQNNIIWVNFFSLKDVINLIGNIFNNYVSLKNIFNSIFSTILENIDILIIDILFISFLIKNNFSVVLGDKSHHEMVFHLAQINHILIFSLIFFPMLNYKTLRNVNKILTTKKKTARFLLIFFIITFAVFQFNKFSYIHDFILSDNRHYIFYYFKKIYLKDNIRYALLVYVSFTYSIIINDNLNLLKDNRIISLIICAFLSLVPSKLVELRYFTPVYIIFNILINYNKENFGDLHQYIFNWFNIIVQFVINCITIYIFLFKQFENKFMQNEISRFMY